MQNNENILFEIGDKSGTVTLFYGLLCAAFLAFLSREQKREHKAP